MTGQHKAAVKIRSSVSHDRISPKSPSDKEEKGRKMGLFGTLRSKIEYAQLERRYTQRRRRRTGFEAGAEYVDGEYRYDSLPPSAFAAGGASAARLAMTMEAAARGTALSEAATVSPSAAAPEPTASPAVFEAESRASRRRTYFVMPSGEARQEAWRESPSRGTLGFEGKRPILTVDTTHHDPQGSAEHWKTAKARLPTFGVREVVVGGGGEGRRVRRLSIS
nr:hypothetical protein CFP56_09603 [Quercus suber]